MSVNLQKGQRISLEKSLKKALVGLGWDINRYDSGSDFDLDASAFLLGANGKVLKDEDFIFYNNPNGRNGALIYTGDNRTGVGEGDDEVILVDFSKIPAEVEKIAFCVTIHEAEARKQNFGQVSNAYIRIAKINDEFDSVGTPVLRFDLGEDYSIETTLVIAEVYKKDGDWKFNALGAGFQGGLATLCRYFGVNI